MFSKSTHLSGLWQRCCQFKTERQFGVWWNVSRNGNWQDKSCTRKSCDGGHSHWSDPWQQRSHICVADSNKSWICVFFLLPASGTLMWSGWLMDQKPAHSAHWLTLMHFYHITFPPPPPPTAGLCGIKAHFMQVSGGWNREWCHYTPH